MTWLRTKQATEALGVTKRYLLDMRPNFKQGIHYRNIGNSIKRPTYQFNVEAINKFLNKSPEKR